MRVLDSHLHLWDPQRLDYTWLSGPLAPAFGAEEFDRVRLPSVAQESAVFVQAQSAEDQFLDEVAWVEGIARQVGVSAVVAGARLDRGAGTRAHLDALGRHPLVVGVRHLLQGEPVGFARTEAFVQGARAVAERGWSFDACVGTAEQMADVAALAASVPDLRIVLDHLGKPAVGTAAAPRRPSVLWVAALGAVARHPLAVCKISGLPAEAGGRWDGAQLEPFLDAALAAFGPDRLMWGSDWPVSSVGDAYDPGARVRWFASVASWAESRGVAPDPLFWSTAAGFYSAPV